MAEFENEILVMAGQSPSTTVGELYRRHADWLRSLLKRRLRLQNGDIDDLVQDTYLRAARTPPSEVSHSRAFLAQVALNLFRDGKRREAVRAGHRDAVRLAAVNESHPGNMAEQEAALQLRQLITEMPEPLRDVFVLSRFRQMSNKDIARHFGLSIKTIEWRMSKALDYCMGRLQE